MPVSPLPVNNAVARVAGLVGVPVVGVVVAGMLVGDTFRANDESVQAFRQVVFICAVLVAAGGVVGAVGIINPRRVFERGAVRVDSSSEFRSPRWIAVLLMCSEPSPFVR